MQIPSYTPYAVAKPDASGNQTVGLPLPSQPASSSVKPPLRSCPLTTPVGTLQVWSRNGASFYQPNPLATGQPLMLLVHGLGGRAEDMGELVEKLSPSLASMSFVGITLPEITRQANNLPTQHHFSQQSIAQVRNTIDYLAQQPGHPPLYILAYSLGTPITVQALAQAQFKSRQNTAGLLLLAPAFDFSPSLNQKLVSQDSVNYSPSSSPFTQWSHENQLRPFMRQSGELLKQGLNQIPHHIFVSQNDTAISLPAIQQSMNRSSELSVLPTGSHESIIDPDLVSQVTSWLAPMVVAIEPEDSHW